MTLEQKMKDDKWKDEYIEELVAHIKGLQKSGVSELLEQELKQWHPSDAYFLYRNKHDTLPFGSLRGKNSAVLAYEEYVASKFDTEKKDEIFEFLRKYGEGVRDSSWAPMVQIFKEFLVRQRQLPHDDYYWGSTGGVAKKLQDVNADIMAWRSKYFTELPGKPLKVRELSLRRAVVTWHAFTLEMLRCTQFPANDRTKETITVVRTESAIALKQAMLVDLNRKVSDDEAQNPSQLFGKGLIAKRGALESSSLYTIKNIYGNVVTQYTLPHHRAFAIYMAARPLSKEHTLSFFERDTENEVTFMPEGLIFSVQDVRDLKFAK